ncbi:MAG: hypothetical protein ABSF90_31425 [Syntrophobacteraceae bacterium]|jgi:hypothetical protein
MIIHGWVEEALARPEQVRASMWTETSAVGSRDFVGVIKRGPGVKAKGCRISGIDGESALGETWTLLRTIILGSKTCF